MSAYILLHEMYTSNLIGSEYSFLFRLTNTLIQTTLDSIKNQAKEDNFDSAYSTLIEYMDTCYDVKKSYSNDTAIDKFLSIYVKSYSKSLIQSKSRELFKYIKLQNNRVHNVLITDDYMNVDVTKNIIRAIKDNNVHIAPEDIRVYAYNERTVYGYLNSAEKELFYRIINSYIRNLKVTKRSFDVSIYTPVYNLFNNKSGIITIMARLNNALQCLRFGGTFVFAIPITLLNNSMRTILLKHLTNIQIKKCSYLQMNSINTGANDSSIAPSFVIIYGTKQHLNTVQDINSIDYINDMIYRCYKEESDDTDSFMDIENTINDYNINLPAFEKRIVFRGNKLTENEIQAMNNNNKADVMFLNKQINSGSNELKQPLLPFSLGQLGLILVSGAMDGVIKEDDNYNHVVKGMSIKTIRSIEDEDDPSNKSIIHSSQVKISMFKSNGDFIVL